MQGELVYWFVCPVKLHLPLRHKEKIYMTQMFVVRDGGDVVIGIHPSVFKWTLQLGIEHVIPGTVTFKLWK